MDRREFLRAGALLGGAAAFGVGGSGAFALPPRGNAFTAARTKHRSILAAAPGDSGIDTIVLVMMENRSFDSYLGYLAEDGHYLERGASLYGHRFHVNGRVHQAFRDPAGKLVETSRRVKEHDPLKWRACDHPDPGHGWDAGRAERDDGFLAAGSGNDPFALSYFLGPDLPVYKKLARRFTICDDHHASVLGPTFPNREYFLSAQSGGHKDNYLPIAEGGFQWATIVDRLAAAGVTVADYATDLPPLLLWGARMNPFIKNVADYYTAAAAGSLPQVCFVDPSLAGPNRTDDHPHGDPRAAQGFVRDVFAAFARSSQWERGLFVLTYDEWGGFYDHVKPPLLPDDRASAIDQENFAQAGFRVPTFLCSPRSLPNYVDHRRYDHTSVLRFLEWRFLGAPPEGPAAGAGGSPWWLTSRDQNAANIGRSLSLDMFDPDPHFDLDVPVDPPSPPCATGDAPVQGRSSQGEVTPFEAALAAGYFERVGYKVH